MRKGEIVTGALSGLSFVAALDAYVGTGTSSWLADICFTGDTPPMIEGMPVMENHSKHAAYFASAGLTFLAAALGWEYSETQIAKCIPSEPQGIERKRLLAGIIYVTTAAQRANRRVIEDAFEQTTGYALGQNEAREAFDYLMQENAPELDRILAGASKRERQTLLRTVVLTWSAHGMDSEKATLVTERIVALLGFDQDDICKTLDRAWLWDRASTAAKVTCRYASAALKTAVRATVASAKASARVLAPHARRIGIRAYAAIQR